MLFKPGMGSTAAAAAAAGVTYAGQPLQAVDAFVYLGVPFSTSAPFAAAAQAIRAQKGRATVHIMRKRCADLGVESGDTQRRLFLVIVLPVLTYGAEVWAPQLIPKSAQQLAGGGSKSERVQLDFLRHLLASHQSTPNAVLLAESGMLPLWIRWLEHAARRWNDALAQPDDSLLHLALSSNIALALASPQPQPHKQSWARQLHSALAIVGRAPDLASPAPIDIADLRTAALSHHLSLLTAAAARPGASMLSYYTQQVCGGELAAEDYASAPYLAAVRRRQHRTALAQIRTGSHWLEEATGRRQRRARDERTCPHCAQLSPPTTVLEDPSHMALHCPLYSPLRQQWPELFPHSPPPTLTSLLQQPAKPLAAFFAACRTLRHPPPSPPATNPS